MPYEKLIQLLESDEVPAPPTTYSLGTPLAFFGYLDGHVPAERGAASLNIANGYLIANGAFRDSNIKNNATKDNQETWTTGDVFEFFFQPHGREDYYEAHGTPEGIKLQLHIQDYRTFRQIPFEQKICDVGTTVENQIFREQNLWLVQIKIPLVRLGLGMPGVPGSRFAFVRWNYPHDEANKPVTTATQIFPKTAHFPPKWHRITFP